jgi:hypothetical protein
MKLDLKYPFLTSGIPKRNTRRRDIYVTMFVNVDVPEVSKSETDVVFKSSQTCRFHDLPPDYGNGPYVKLEYRVETSPGGIDLRSHAGKIYRRIGTPHEILQDTREAFKLGRAFPHGIGDTDFEYGANISFVTIGNSNALSAVLVRQWDWELERASISNSRVVNAWPMTMGGVTRHGTREATVFSEVMSQITEIDGHTSDRSIGMIQHQSQRLLAIDGEIWMSCRPPCFVVDLDMLGGRDICATLSLAHAFDGLDTNLSRRYFALDDLDSAREYLQQCARKPKQEDCNYDLYEAIPEYNVIAPEYTSYDPDHEELSRIGYVLASECSRYIARTHQWIDGRKQDSLQAAMRAVEGTNYVLGEFGDVTPYVEDLCAIWNDLGRPSTFSNVGPAPARKRFGDMMIRRAWNLIENAPIDLSEIHPLAIPKLHQP